MKTVLDQVKIYENAFSQEEFNEGMSWVSKARWKSNQSNQKDGIDNDWVSPNIESYSPTIRRFWGAGRMWHKEEFFNTVCLNRIREITGEPTLELNHLLLNGQTACQDGDPHFDSEIENAYTFIWFLNPYWDFRWGGQFVAFDRYIDPDTNETIVLDKSKHVTVFPMPNLCVFFPANIIHFAFGPTKDFSGMRISMAFKLYKKTEEST
jgi:hypothetical protein